MAKLVNLKLSKAEAKAEMRSPEPDGAPRYPWGACLRLDSDLIDKLGLDDLEVGQTVVIEARGIVTMYSESQRQSHSDCSAEIQLTDMAVTEDPGKRREKARAQHRARLS